jgi:two-component system, NarL family, sensor kinase
MNNYSLLITFLIGTLIFLMLTFFIIFSLISFKKKQYGSLLERQELSNRFQTQLLQSRLEVQEQSFQNMSQEIHDNIGQLLSLIKMQLYNIKTESSEEPIIEKATQCSQLMTKVIGDLRSVSHTLNSHFVNGVGLAEAIKKDLQYICSAKSIAGDLEIDGDEYMLGPERELLIFRIVQEAMSNAMKHGTPTKVVVQLKYAPTLFSVTISDNGSGFDPSIPRKMDGIGLNNMQIRADLLKGRLHVDSAPGKGTKICLEMSW